MSQPPDPKLSAALSLSSQHPPPFNLLRPHLPTLPDFHPPHPAFPEHYSFNQSLTLLSSHLPSTTPPYLLYFVTELVTAIRYGAVTLLRLGIHCADASSHHLVLSASNTPPQHVNSIARLLSDVSQAGGVRHSLSLHLLRARHASARDFERLVWRAALRLAVLDAREFGGGREGGVGSLQFRGGCWRWDARVKKSVEVFEEEERVARAVAAGIAERVHLRATGEVLLKHGVGGVGSGRVVALYEERGFGGRQGGKQVGEAIWVGVRKGMLWVEMGVRGFGEWEWGVAGVVLREVISTAVLVFRYESLEGLAGMIGASKCVTDQFKGLTSERERVLYAGGGGVEAVRETAMERRMLVPGEREVLDGDEEEVAGEIATRARGFTVIVNREAEERIEGALRVLNGGVREAEMKGESLKVVETLGRMKNFWKTTVQVNDDGKAVKVSRGDTTGYMGTKGMMPEAEYRSLADVTEKAPLSVDVRLGLEEGVLKGVKKGWAVVRRVSEWVSREGGYLCVADERKTVLRKGKDKFVVAVDAVVLGGGRNKYLHAQLIRECVNAVKKDVMEEEKAGDGKFVATRALLALMPQIKGA